MMMSLPHRFDYYAYYAGAQAQPPDSSPDRLVLTYYELLAATEQDKEQLQKCKTNWNPQLSQQAIAEIEDVVPKDFPFGLLPRYSFAIRFQFTLARPYISKDDQIFHVLDNPIVRDKVFFAPMVRPSSWKGNLHSALWRLGHRKETDSQMQRLFGNVRGRDEQAKGQAGRLIFFPSFFQRICKEIINPHDRETRVGKKPILFECVPIGEKSTFCLLYVPFDAVDQDDQVLRLQAIQDLMLIAKGLQAMMCQHGFSAKRSSGYGIINDKVTGGQLTIRVAEQKVAESDAQRPQTERPRYLDKDGNLLSEYLNPDGTFRERTQDELKISKSAQQLYDKAKKHYERKQSSVAVAAPPPPVNQHWFNHQFDSLSQLCSLTKEIQASWKEAAQ